MKRDLKYRLKPKRIKTHCQICENTFKSSELEQHRINPDDDYSDQNVIIACDGCHKIIHKLMRFAKLHGNLVIDNFEFVLKAVEIVRTR